MKKLVLAVGVLVIGAGAFAEPLGSWYKGGKAEERAYLGTVKITVVPTVAGWKYSSGNRKNGFTAGLTLSGTVGKLFGIDGTFDWTRIKYKVGRDWRQYDFTVGGTYYGFYPYYIRGAFHYLNDNYNSITDEGKVFYLGVGTTTLTFWNANISYSDYKQGLTVWNGVANVGTAWYPNKWSKVVLWGGLRGIKVSKPEVFGWSKKKYFSVHGGATYYYSYYAYIGVKGFAGEKVLSVENGGNVVYNLGDKYKGGLTLYGGYEIFPKAWLSGGVYINAQKEAGTKTSLKTYGGYLSFSYQF